MIKKTCLLLFLTVLLGMFTVLWATTLNVPSVYTTIQAAIDAASDGDIIQVAAGEYPGYINVNKRVSIIGAGSGSDPLVDTIIMKGPEAFDPYYGVLQLNASGLDADNPVLLQNFRVNCTDRAGISVGRFTYGTGVNVSYLALNNVQVWGNNANAPTEQERGFYVDLTSNVSYITFTDCQFNNLTYGWYFQKQVSSDTSSVSYLTASNCVFNHNNHKGIYAEKLDHAVLTGCSAANNGYDASLLPTYFYDWCAGFDINLKAGTYSNIEFNNCTLTANGIGGSKEGAGLAIKGRSDGTTYGPYPATVDQVSIIGCTITGNERGVRFGEPGKDNPSPTNVVVTGGNISNNLMTYTLGGGSAYGDIVNQTSNSSSISYNGYVLPTGTSVFNVGVGGTIQTAINQAIAGGVINVTAGTYPENVVVNKALTINGPNLDFAGNGTRNAEAVIAPASGLPVSITVSGVTINGFEITAPGYQYGININGTTSNQTVKCNYIHDLGTSITNANVHAIVYQLANAVETSNIAITDNYLHNISSYALTGYSAAAIGILQSTSTGTLTGLSIERNVIDGVTVKTDNWPSGKLAYGIQINIGGGSSYLTLGKVVNAVVQDNIITDLEGFITTGIGLEGNTENAIVKRNDVSYLTSYKLADRAGGGYDMNGLKIENNRYVGSLTVEDNVFRADTFVHSGTPNLGYAVSNYVPATVGTLHMIGNWMGTAVLSEILDNATLTGKLFAKADCAMEFLPYSTSASPVNRLGLGFAANITQGTSYLVIQEAINAANDGDEIQIQGGVYDEALNIDGINNLTLTGLGSEVNPTVLKPTTTVVWDGYGHATDRRTAIRVVNSDNFHFNNITLDCELIRNNGYYGVLYGDSDGGVFSSSILKNMYVDTAHYYDIMVALRSDNATAEAKDDVTFTDCQFIDTGRVGILAHDFVNVIITDCDFHKTTHTFGYGMEIGSESTATVTGSTLYGYDTAALSDGSTSSAIYVENCFTNGTVVATAKPVEISDNNIYNNQSGITIGNQFNNYAGNVDITATISDNTFTNNAFYAILVTDEDRSNGSSVTTTISGNTISAETAESIGILIYSVGDADLTATIQNNVVTGCDYSLYVYDWGTDPATSSFTVSASNNTFSGAQYGIYNGEVHWAELTRLDNPSYAGNIFQDNVMHLYLEGLTQDEIQEIVEDNTIIGAYVTDEYVVYGSSAAVVYADAPKDLIKDAETQTYSIKVLSTEDLRAYTARVVIPKVDYAAPENFAIGSLFGAESFFDVLDMSDATNWIYEVTGSLLGGVNGLDGTDIVLCTFELTSLTDRTNLAGSTVDIPSEFLELRDDNNPYHEIPCMAVVPFIAIIDAEEATMVHNNVVTYPSGVLLNVLGDGSGDIDRPLLNFTFTDNYNLDDVLFLIQDASLAAPTQVSAFPAQNIVTDFDGTTTTLDWQLDAQVNSLDSGTYTVYYLVMDDAGNFQIYDWDFIIDVTATGPIVWDEVIPCRTTIKQNNSIDLKWTNPEGAVKNHIWYLSYASLPDASAYPEYASASNYTITNDINPYSDGPSALGWTKCPEITAAGTYTWTGMERGYYYITVYVEDASGNISAAPAAPFYRESISYWPGDVTGSANGIVHTVTSADIALLSGAWGSHDGQPSFSNIVDVGPTVDNARRSRPTPDNVINIEDLMIFAMNYNNTVYTYYPRDPNAPQIVPIRIELLSRYENNELVVDLSLAQNAGFVRALNIPISYGEGLQFTSATQGEIWPEDSILLTSLNNGVVEVSISTLGNDCIVEGNGCIAELRFAVNSSDNSLELMPMIARAADNSEITIENNPTGPSDGEDPVVVIPTVSYLGNCYPNPFNPTTTIQYGMKEAGRVQVNVYNARGQLVKQLVNGTQPAGTYNLIWNGRDSNGRSVSSGLYFFRMITADKVQTKKAILMK